VRDLQEVTLFSREVTSDATSRQRQASKPGPAILEWNACRERNEAPLSIDLRRLDGDVQHGGGVVTARDRLQNGARYHAGTRGVPPPTNARPDRPIRR